MYNKGWCIRWPCDITKVDVSDDLYDIAKVDVSDDLYDITKVDVSDDHVICIRCPVWYEKGWCIRWPICTYGHVPNWRANSVWFNLLISVQMFSSVIRYLEPELPVLLAEEFDESRLSQKFMKLNSSIAKMVSHWKKENVSFINIYFVIACSCISISK